MRILIVEDEVNAREGLAELLGKISPEYIVCGKASDGEQGIQMADALKPDLVIADIEMPRLNGLEMIEAIKELGQEPLFVLLSGYSDFKYAQRGIKLGVDEYLLKPITYSNLKNIMMEMGDKLSAKQAKASMAENALPKEDLLKEVLLGSERICELAYKILEKSVKPGRNMFLAGFHFRHKSTETQQRLIHQLVDFLDFYRMKTYFYSFIKEYNIVAVLIHTSTELPEIIKMLKYNLLFSFSRNDLNDVSISMLELNELCEIKYALNKLEALSKWSLIFGTKEILWLEFIQNHKKSECIYPRSIEAEAQHAVQNNDYGRLSEINRKLVSYLKRDVCDPFKALDFCSRYVFSIISYLALLKGSNNSSLMEPEGQGILELIKNSCTLQELEEHLCYFVEKICQQEDEGAKIKSLPVRKAVNHIEEYYNDRISLEEIAAKINITPEYLSRLFTKEIGKSFSDYVKEYRIEKARQLLLNDKMKIYEIAEKVGYSDPKYFCKIFKEVTGLSPKEYMKAY